MLLLVADDLELLNFNFFWSAYFRRIRLWIWKDLGYWRQCHVLLNYYYYY